MALMCCYLSVTDAFQNKNGLVKFVIIKRALSEKSTVNSSIKYALLHLAILYLIHSP